MDQSLEPTNPFGHDDLDRELGNEMNGILDYFNQNVLLINSNRKSERYTSEKLKIHIEQEKTRMLIRDIFRNT